MTTDTWHLDKTVNIAHLLTTLAMVSGLFVWAASINERIAVIEATQRSEASKVKLADDLLDEKINAQTARSDAEMRAIANRFDRIEALLTRIEDRMNAKGRP